VQIALGDTEFDRRVRLASCCNFRDAGGYATRDGRTLRTGRLYRGDGPRALTDADGEIIGGLGLATVIDLRTPAEAAAHRSYTEYATGALEYRLELMDVLPTEAELGTWRDPATVARHYEELLVVGADAICEVLAILTDPAAYPVLLHCTAGKDRTGVLIALVLSLLGVPDETIVEDYARSGPAMVELVESWLEAAPTERVRIERMAPAITAAHPETMEQLLRSIREVYGSVDGYVDSLGMQSAVEYVRACLLV
jgi:protein-tyrosine phosphatase